MRARSPGGSVPSGSTSLRNRSSAAARPAAVAAVRSAGVVRDQRVLAARLARRLLTVGSGDAGTQQLPVTGSACATPRPCRSEPLALRGTFRLVATASLGGRPGRDSSRLLQSGGAG